MLSTVLSMTATCSGNTKVSGLFCASLHRLRWWCLSSCYQLICFVRAMWKIKVYGLSWRPICKDVRTSLLVSKKLRIKIYSEKDIADHWTTWGLWSADTCIIENLVYNSWLPNNLITAPQYPWEVASRTLVDTKIRRCSNPSYRIL